MKPRPVHYRGFLIPEAILGLALIGIVAGALTVALSRENAAERRMADGREAVRAAEATLTNLRAGIDAPSTNADVKVVVRPIAGATDIGPWKWVEVTATVRGQTRTLTGLAPEGAAR
jgi:type II secretory pathway pseudopilin PulG